MIQRRYSVMMAKRRYVNTAILCSIAFLVALVLHRPFSSTGRAVQDSKPLTAPRVDSSHQLDQLSRGHYCQ